jgi:hypothetical protein
VAHRTSVLERHFGAASTRVLDRRAYRSRTLVGMTPEEIADVVHLRRARDLMERLGFVRRTEVLRNG